MVEITPPVSKFNKRKIILIAFIIILALILFILAFYYGIVVREYKIESNLLISGSSVKIVLISDLHSTIHGKDQQSLIQKIKQANPDLILMAGDIADDEVPFKGTRLLLEGIRDVAPIYYVTGNHEYWCDDINEIRNEMREYGINILSDSYEQIEINENNIVIAGIDDPVKRIRETPGYNQSAEMESAFGKLDEIDSYKILIAHRPESIKDYIKYPFDLIVSGHAHGGQVRIPYLLNGLFAPNQGWFPKYAGGLYEHGEAVHIVSRGLSINPILPRVFNPPELVVINITGKK